MFTVNFILAKNKKFRILVLKDKVRFSDKHLGIYFDHIHTFCCFSLQTNGTDVNSCLQNGKKLWHSQCLPDDESLFHMVK